MILLNFNNNKVDEYKNEIKTISNDDIKLWVRENILSKIDLQFKKFELNNISNETSLIQKIRSKLSCLNESSIKMNYKKIKIYQIILLQVKTLKGKFYLFKIKKINKNEILFFEIKNKFLKNFTSSLNLKLEKTMDLWIWNNTNNINNPLINTNYNVKNYHKLEKKINLISNQRKLLFKLSELQNFFKLKIETKLKIIYRLKKKNFMKKEHIIIKKKCLETVLNKKEKWKLKMCQQIKDLKAKINQLIIDNSNLKKSIINGYLNFEVKIVSL